MKGENAVIDEALHEVYSKLKLNFYQGLFQSGDKKAANLTTMETFLVEIIYALNGPTINEVSRFTGDSQPNVAYKVNNLVKKGYVERVRSKLDKREVNLIVTEKFRNYYGKNYEYIGKVTRRMKERFSEEDVKKFEEILTVASRELMPEITLRLLENSGNFEESKLFKDKKVD